jgi:hypothetical protein
MVIYHQLESDAWRSARYRGLQKSSRGVKGRNEQVIKTDAFLDQHRPSFLKAKGVSRNHNLYGYLGDGTNLIDIQTGKLCPATRKAAEKGQVLLQVEVAVQDCWVSDLDLYDAVKNASSHPISALEHAGASYWASLQPLGEYDGSIRRPEVMITRDVGPEHIKPVRYGK